MILPFISDRTWLFLEGKTIAGQFRKATIFNMCRLKKEKRINLKNGFPYTLV